MYLPSVWQHLQYLELRLMCKDLVCSRYQEEAITRQLYLEVSQHLFGVYRGFDLCRREILSRSGSVCRINYNSTLIPT
jgi:predicted Zn-dependent protease with MMP-like domain